MRWTLEAKSGWEGAVSWKQLLGGLIAAMSVCGGALADPVADFYKGKTVSIIVSSPAGGGYDTLARTVARHLPQHIPGNPSIVVQNMPGAGGIVATNHVYANAARDGTVIGAPNNNVPFEPLFGTPQVKFDPKRLQWLGTPSVEVGMLTIWHATPVMTWQEARTRELTMGASGANSTPSFYARLLNETLGLKLKIITGFRGQGEAFLAMQRGELDGYSSVFWSALKATKPDWIRDKQVKLLVQFGLEAEKEIAQVPFILDLVTNPEDRLLVQAACAPLAAGRPYMLPPEVPAERVSALRKAMMATFKSTAFVADATKTGLDVRSPRSGEELSSLIDRIYRETSPALVERLRKLNNP